MVVRDQVTKQLNEGVYPAFSLRAYGAGTETGSGHYNPGISST